MRGTPRAEPLVCKTDLAEFSGKLKNECILYGTKMELKALKRSEIVGEKQETEREGGKPHLLVAAMGCCCSSRIIIAKQGKKKEVSATSTS